MIDSYPQVSHVKLWLWILSLINGIALSPEYGFETFKSPFQLIRWFPKRIQVAPFFDFTYWQQVN